MAIANDVSLVSRAPMLIASSQWSQSHLHVALRVLPEVLDVPEVVGVMVAKRNFGHRLDSGRAHLCKELLWTGNSAKDNRRFRGGWNCDFSFYSPNRFPSQGRMVCG